MAYSIEDVNDGSGCRFILRMRPPFKWTPIIVYSLWLALVVWVLQRTVRIGSKQWAQWDLASAFILSLLVVWCFLWAWAAFRTAFALLFAFVGEETVFFFPERFEAEKRALFFRSKAARKIQGPPNLAADHGGARGIYFPSEKWTVDFGDGLPESELRAILMLLQQRLAA